MHDNQYPPCIVRISPRASSIPIEVRFLTVAETENLLDSQEELISTPMKIQFESPVQSQQNILVKILIFFLSISGTIHPRPSLRHQTIISS